MRDSEIQEISYDQLMHFWDCTHMVELDTKDKSFEPCRWIECKNPLHFKIWLHLVQYHRKNGGLSWETAK